MAGIDIITVEGGSKLKDFIDLPWKIYAEHPNWVPSFSPHFPEHQIRYYIKSVRGFSDSVFEVGRIMHRGRTGGREPTAPVTASFARAAGIYTGKGAHQLLLKPLYKPAALLHQPALHFVPLLFLDGFIALMMSRD
jgi:hypothetical protein